MPSFLFSFSSYPLLLTTTVVSFIIVIIIIVIKVIMIFGAFTATFLLAGRWVSHRSRQDVCSHAKASTDISDRWFRRTDRANCVNLLQCPQNAEEVTSTRASAVSVHAAHSKGAANRIAVGESLHSTSTWKVPRIVFTRIFNMSVLRILLNARWGGWFSSKRRWN